MFRLRLVREGRCAMSEMRGSGCPGIYSGCGMAGAFMESFFNIKNISIKRCRENEI